MTPVVRVLQGAPCLVYEWTEPPAPHVVYGRRSALTHRPSTAPASTPYPAERGAGLFAGGGR